MQLVLLGAGHANLQVVDKLDLATLHAQHHPVPLLITDDRYTYYSGMLHGVISGVYKLEEARVDVEELCQRKGWRYCRGSAQAIDAEQRTLLLDDGRSVPYDLLSVDCGSSLRGLQTPGALEHAVLARPASRFFERVEQLQQRWEAAASESVPRAVVVGAGAGGVELAFALRARLMRAAWGWIPEVTLVDEACGLPALGPERALVRRRLALDGIRLLEGYRVTGVRPGGVSLASVHTGEALELPTDGTVWATGPAPPPLLAAASLAKAPDGFLAVRATLESGSSAAVFAAGDCASVLAADGGPGPKSGVQAVRAGAVLLANLPHALSGRGGPPPARLQPAADALRLVATSDGSAIGCKWGVALEGPLLWRLKDAIDRRWVARFASA